MGVISIVYNQIVGSETGTGIGTTSGCSLGSPDGTFFGRSEGCNHPEANLERALGCSQGRAERFSYTTKSDRQEPDWHLFLKIH